MSYPSDCKIHESSSESDLSHSFSLQHTNTVDPFSMNWWLFSNWICMNYRIGPWALIVFLHTFLHCRFNGLYYLSIHRLFSRLFSHPNYATYLCCNCWFRNVHLRSLATLWIRMMALFGFINQQIGPVHISTMSCMLLLLFCFLLSCFYVFHAGLK